MQEFVTGTTDVNPKWRFLRFWAAFAVGALVLLLAVDVFRGSRTSLSPLEARFAGEWYDTQPGDTRSFHPDRTFTTSNRQFIGNWHIENKRLVLTYWQPYELPINFSLTAFVHSIRRIRKTTCGICR
jgi:hypothetical protein